MTRIVLLLFKIALALILTGTSVWAGMALWFRLPGPAPVPLLAATAFWLLGLITVIALFRRSALPALAVYTLAFLGLLMWWSTIRPTAEGNWSPPVARQVTGVIDGDTLTLTDLRAFAWRSDTDFTPVWETRRYDLTQITGMDLIMSYWAGPEMAHFIISFEFATGTPLAWSIEVRREVNGTFSPIADLFKSNMLVFVASDERDVVGLRTNIRGEDVRMFRLNVPPAVARTLLEQYVRDANTLAAQPAFYNSLTSNCTTVVVKMLRAIGINVPLDWRLIANGYLPDLLYARGVLDTRVPLDQVRALGRLNERAVAVGLTPGFSDAIRVGVPVPAP